MSFQSFGSSRTCTWRSMPAARRKLIGAQLCPKRRGSVKKYGLGTASERIGHGACGARRRGHDLSEQVLQRQNHNLLPLDAVAEPVLHQRLLEQQPEWSVVPLSQFHIRDALDPNLQRQIASDPG